MQYAVLVNVKKFYLLLCSIIIALRTLLFSLLGLFIHSTVDGEDRSY